MSQNVNNFFESLTNFTNPQYAGNQQVHTPGPSYMEGVHQSGASNTSFQAPPPISIPNPPILRDTLPSPGTTWNH